jgi:hypothetical protein
MPFDGTGTAKTDELRILDKVLEVLGPHGERWIKDTLSNEVGDHCVLGALRHARRKLKTARGDKATLYIKLAINLAPRVPQGCRSSIATFNDDDNITFVQVRDVLRAARAIAQIEHMMPGWIANEGLERLGEVCAKAVAREDFPRP